LRQKDQIIAGRPLPLQARRVAGGGWRDRLWRVGGWGSRLPPLLQRTSAHGIRDMVDRAWGSRLPPLLQAAVVSL